MQIKQTKDKPYLYTANPSHIHHRSNKIPHCLKIVDFYVQVGYPPNFIVEPILGSYEPDVFYRDKQNRSICAEIQITPISIKKMQEKVDCFVKEFGREHDSKILLLCTGQRYDKLKVPHGFSIIRQALPLEV